MSQPKSNKKPAIFFVVKEREPLFSKKNRALLKDPLDDNNPITVQVLGICSALAVTSLVVPSVVMSIAVVFVCAFSSLFTSFPGCFAKDWTKQILTSIKQLQDRGFI